ncbi:MAG: nucleotidyltransferase family protein [Bacteroidaceae bacterium]|nr:nucleotidyltransferase family protein [Bacteroidaceae bacterium]
MRQDKNIEAFFALVKAGLWSKANLNDNLDFDGVDWGEVYRLAEEQSVIGLVADGIDRFKLHVPSFKIPQEWALQFIGSALQLEQQNKGMNTFIAKLVAGMRKVGIYTLLVKGQGLAQCYENPLWRSCGDVDLLLSDDNYQKAKAFLLPKASFVEDEEKHKKHLAMTINDWMVELHGSLRCGFSARIDRSLDKIYHDTFYGGNVRSWTNERVQVFMLGKENDVLYVFVHFLNHFYKGGVGLRQICDWCRLLWTYRDSLDVQFMETRIREMGLMSEWRAFGAYAVKYLGMDATAIPLFDDNADLKSKTRRINKFILSVGNMGHNRSEKGQKSYLSRKVRSFGQRMVDLFDHAMIFPIDTLKFFPSIMMNGIRQK